MFFFSDPRCNFKNGKIQLQTEFPFYEPGNIVNGKIFIECAEPMQAEYIELKVKGKEDVKFIRFWHETEGEGEDAHTVEHHEKMHKDKTFLEYKQKVFHVPGGMIHPGVSMVSFQFSLPNNIPSSFYYKDKKCREKPKACIKYTVQVKLEIPGEDLKYKQVLVIREPPVAFKTDDH